MSGKGRQNLSEKDHDSDDMKIENSDVDNEEATLDDAVKINPNSSEIAHHLLQKNASDNTEVYPNDVIVVQQLTHESLEGNSSENSQYKVIEFPGEDENETHTHLSQACADDMGKASFQASPQEFDKNKSAITSVKKQKGNLIEVIDTESLNKKVGDIICTTETWGEAERKRKKRQISEMENKRPKELSNPCIQCFEDTIEVQSSSSGEFADAEDSSSSDNNGSNFRKTSVEKAKQIPLKDLSSVIQPIKEREIESPNTNITKVELSDISNSFQNEQFQDKTKEKTRFPPFLKGETLPAFLLSDEEKKKFELSMPTIFEVRESESDEKIPQTLQSKTNPLKMKTKVGKRKDKCNICNVRLGLCAIECRCGGYFCSKHRYDKEHNCTFDYKKMGAAEIRKNNPKIVAEKIRKL